MASPLPIRIAQRVLLAALVAAVAAVTMSSASLAAAVVLATLLFVVVDSLVAGRPRIAPVVDPATTPRSISVDPRRR